MGLFLFATRRTRFGLRHLPGLRAAVLLALAPLPLLAAWGAYSLFQLRPYHCATDTIETRDQRVWVVHTEAWRAWSRVSLTCDWAFRFRPYVQRDPNFMLSVWMLGPMRIVERRTVTRTTRLYQLQTSQN